MSKFRMIQLMLAVTLPFLPIAAPAGAQTGGEPLKVVAIPPLATPSNVKTEGGDTGVIGVQIAQLIAADLRRSGAAFPAGPEKLRAYSPTEAGAPQYAQWANTGASALVTGYVQARSDGRLNVVCYLYDTRQRREMTRTGFAVAATDWRRAAHRCADAFYTSLTGRKGYFDTRVAYVAETGSITAQVKRLAIMDFDGTGHEYLTPGAVTVLSPVFAPDGASLAYVSFGGGRPHVRIFDIETEQDREVGPPDAISFAPAFSPDGRRLVIAMAVNGNTDLYSLPVGGGFPQRLTMSVGTDTSASFSPDGRQIVFSSDRSGTPQLYVMNADGSGERRISFGSGDYSSPAWSPDGERIAFAKFFGGNRRVGVVRTDGRDERMLTDGWQDDAPSWSAGSQEIAFHRTVQGGGQSSIYVTDLGGGQPRRLPAPQGGSDPAFSPGAE